MSGLPEFQPDGFLPKGIWSCTGEEFLNHFCSDQPRRSYYKAVQDVFDFGLDTGAERVIVGGSFVSRKNSPSDLDCVLVYPDETRIPERTERLSVEGLDIDIFFGIETEPQILSSFIELFSKTRTGAEVGVVDVRLWSENGQPLWDVMQEPDPGTLEIVKRVYLNRRIIDKNNSRKVLVTIHGIKSSGEWNSEISHIASSNGWIVAPFVYGPADFRVFFDNNRRDRIANDFRDHLEDISLRYGANISIIAHSFGTYIAMSYLLGFDIPPVTFDSLILTGSILNQDLDFRQIDGKCALVINEIAPNDNVVPWAYSASLWREKLLGRSGQRGFNQNSKILKQYTSHIFNHNNVIRRDVIAKRWMPWLEAYTGKGYTAANERLIQKFLGSEEKI